MKDIKTLITREQIEPYLPKDIHLEDDITLHKDTYFNKKYWTIAFFNKKGSKRLKETDKRNCLHALNSVTGW